MGNSLNDVLNDPSTERLSPDNFCGQIPGESVDPGETQDFNVSEVAPNYVIFMQLGEWDSIFNPFFPFQFICYQKRTILTDGSAIFISVNWAGHSSGINNWEITFNCVSDLIVLRGTGIIGEFVFNQPPGLFQC